MEDGSRCRASKIFHRKTHDQYTVISYRVWVRGWNILEFKMVLCCVSHHRVVQIWIAQILFILCMNKDSELVDCCDRSDLLGTPHGNL